MAKDNRKLELGCYVDKDPGRIFYTHGHDSAAKAICALGVFLHDVGAMPCVASLNIEYQEDGYGGALFMDIAK